MKKTLLLAALGILTLGDANAQFALQNFNATTLPAGWGMIKVDNNTPGTGLNAWIVSQLTANAWMVRSRTTTDSCMLTTSLFTPAGTADRWLYTPQFTVNDPNMVITWEDAAGISGVIDDLEVWVSPTGGTTVPDFTAMIYQAPVSDYLNYTVHGAALGAYNGQSIRIAFRDHSTNKGTLRLDNVQSQVPANALDGGVVGVTIPKINGPAANLTVKTDIQNLGAQNITSLTLTYTVDGGTPVSQNFTSLAISPFSSSTLSFTQQIMSPAAGAHNVVVNIVSVNGGADPVTGNNQATAPFAVATQTVQRNGLIEEFSSSTCAPCASFNLGFDPLVVNNSANLTASHFNVIKYQMNWPSPNNDKSYNQHGLTRQTFYGVSGIPDHYTNGLPGGAGNQAEIDASKTAPAYMDITGSFVIHNGNYDVTYSVTPYFTVPGSYSIHVAAVQRQFDLELTDPSQTTSQSHFVFAMREMFPSGSGTSVANFTAGTPVTGSWMAHPFTVANITTSTQALTNFNWWSHPMGNDIVIFVQDNTTGEVLQSQVVSAKWPTDVANIANDTKVIVYPNPATDRAVISLNMENAASLNINITDALGRSVFSSDQNLASGRHDVVVNTASFAAGLYNITIKTEKGTLTERLTVTK
jgi:hypothetical protein